ncbi:MAG: glycosyltransferase family 2 protein [Omnitrophica bacterium]|nr:glycosyltransferase family 2 protein [Candidatus Omnitrophota bacterium]
MSNNKASLSAVIITKNEEDKIALCLESIKWVDEIIVIDDLSTDKTVEICQKYGARVISHKSGGNFDRQRNIGINNASSDWILQMDADEIVSAELKQAIQKILVDGSGCAGYKFKRKNHFLGKPLLYGGWYHDFLRLFKKNAGKYVGASVHELIDVQGKIGQINADMEHHLCRDISQLIERHNYYTSVEAKRLLRERGLVSSKEIRYHLGIKPLKLFWKTYVKRQGFRDGIHGFIYCILDSYIHCLKWAKYWELTRGKNADNLSR